MHPKIDLNSSIIKYLPELPKHWQSVKVEHLLNHTSGIPHYFDKVMEKECFYHNNDGLQHTFNLVSDTFDSDEIFIERFLLDRAYALRYGSEPESSIQAFELLLKNFHLQIAHGKI